MGRSSAHKYIPELTEMIRASGLKQVYLADKLGITRDGFQSKLMGRTKWKEAEVKKLAVLLRVHEIDLYNALESRIKKSHK